MPLRKNLHIPNIYCKERPQKTFSIKAVEKEGWFFSTVDKSLDLVLVIFWASLKIAKNKEL